MKHILPFLLCSILFFLTPAYAETYIEVGFEQLKDFNGQHIKIKGFLYPRKEGGAVLAAQPNLKTCCVGSRQNAGNQIIIMEPIEWNGRLQVQTAEGKLVADTQKGVFLLESVRLVPEEKSYWGIALGIIIVAVICFGIFYTKKSTH